MPGYGRWLDLFNLLNVEFNQEGQLAITFSDSQREDKKFEITESLYSAYAECTYAALNYNGRQPIESHEKHSTCEPLITSLSRSTKGTVDYIWYYMLSISQVL